MRVQDDDEDVVEKCIGTQRGKLGMWRRATATAILFSVLIIITRVLALASINLGMIVLSHAIVLEETCQSCHVNAMRKIAIAKSFFTMPLSIDDYTSSYLGLGRLYLQSGEYARTLEIMEEASTSMHDSPLFQYILGEARYAVGERTGAAELWDTANLAGHFYLRRQYGKTVETLLYRYEVAGELSFTQYMMLADALTKDLRATVRYQLWPEQYLADMGSIDCDQAVAVYQKAIMLDTESPDPHEGLAYCHYLFGGDWRVGANELLLVIRSSETDVERFHFALQLGEWYRRNSAGPEALEWFEYAEDLFPESPLPNLRKGMTFIHQLGSPRNAISEYGKAISKDPDFAFTYLRMGQAYEVIGDLSSARDNYNRALALDPSLREARQLLDLIPQD